MPDEIKPKVRPLFQRPLSDAPPPVAASPRIWDAGFWTKEAQIHLNLPYLVKGICDRGQIVVVWGAPGSGKTFASISLAAHVSLGLPWAGRRTKKAQVLYVCAESTRARLENRLRALTDKFPDLYEAEVRWCAINADLLHGEQDILDVLYAAKQMTDCGLIVVDTLAVTFGGGNENAPEDMGAYVGNMKRIKAETGAAVLVVHHCGKDEAKGMRGHTSLLGALDAELIVEGQGSGQRVMKAGKIREGSSHCDLFTFQLEYRVLGTDEDGDPVDTCVMVANAGPVVRRPTLRAQVQILGLLEARYAAGERAWTEREIRQVCADSTNAPHRNSIKSALIGLVQSGFVLNGSGGYSLANPPEDAQ